MIRKFPERVDFVVAVELQRWPDRQGRIVLGSFGRARPHRG